jgi:PIN domain nuclease of toxin-antitoxin system
MIVLDTSALLYWTLDPAKLSIKANQAIEQAEKVVISSISVWEIALKVRRGKLTIPLPIAEYIAFLNRIDVLEILAVDVQGWLDNLDLAWEHSDPADRIIVALAARLDCPLLTSDGIIADYYPKTLW